VGIISWILWGLIVGLLARLLTPGRQKIGVMWTILVGIGGSILGGLVATQLLNEGEIGDFGFVSFALAVVGAFLLLAILLAIRGNSSGRKREKRREEH